MCKEERPNVCVLIEKTKRTYVLVVRRFRSGERRDEEKNSWLIRAGACWNSIIHVRTPTFIVIEIKNLPLKFFDTEMINLHSFFEQLPKIASLQIDT